MNLYPIKKLCLKKNITVAELERAVGLSNGAVGKWAECNTRVDSLKRVADYFGVKLDDLLKEGD